MKTNFSIVALVIAVLVGLASIYSIAGVGNSSASPQIVQQINASWEYGILTYNRTNSTYKFTYGEEIQGTVNGTTLANLIRILSDGRNARATYANLLNAIGKNGWELSLIESDENSKTWIFKRDY